MTLGERIQTYRKQSGLSQEKLAEMVTVSRQAVTKWETSQSTPSMENLIKLAEIFKVPLEQLASGSMVETKANQPEETHKQDNTILMANLTILATMFTGGASNGLYQWRYLDNEMPVLTWIVMAFVGGVFVTIRDRMYYKTFRRQLIGYDLLFFLPVIFIPQIPMPYGIALIFMIAYAVTFMMIFIHKKIRPWEWRKSTPQDTF